MISIANPNAGLDLTLTPGQLRREQQRDQRADQRHRALVADLRAAGVTGLRCEQCGTLHSVFAVGGPCNADTDGQGTVCGHWNLKEIRSAVKPARPQTVPFQPLTIQGGAA
ncbi:hypothetical protein GO986_08745 [Deinococcus sp. HMF7620]|uniref:Uncharacterized protein n=1 Tax=Deinococcus arboris TaxID=2682977 RepID=A0A7C9HY11_9DEIO|nr:hypothetical protein [Deinococcus arboris]MVN86850.1 hypothetical protein [Deinococcus arboris]